MLAEAFTHSRYSDTEPWNFLVFRSDLVRKAVPAVQDLHCELGVGFRKPTPSSQCRSWTAGTAFLTRSLRKTRKFHGSVSEYLECVNASASMEELWKSAPTVRELLLPVLSLCTQGKKEVWIRR